MHHISEDSIQRIWDHLNHLTPFSKEEVSMLVNLATPFRLKKGQLIHRQGTIPAYGGFIISGSMRHFHTPKNSLQETTVDFEFENSCFGDLRSIFRNEPTITSLQALEDTVIVRLDKAHYLHLVEHCTPFAKLMILTMEQRYNELMQDSIDTRNEQADARYLKMIDAFPDILQRVSQRYIASYLGIKPQSLSRIRKNMMTRHNKEVSNMAYAFN